MLDKIGFAALRRKRCEKLANIWKYFQQTVKACEPWGESVYRMKPNLPI